jgi:hypothetical protein
VKLAAVVVLLALFAGCAGQDELTGDRRDVGVVTVVFTAMPAKVQAGEVVRLRLRVSDNAGTAQQLTTRTSQLYDFWVTDRGREIWRWSRDQSFVQSVTTTELEAQSSRVFIATWDPDRIGTLKVYGEVKAQGFEGPLEGTVVVR